MSAACSRASSHTSLLTLTMPPTLLQSQSTDATTLENYDIESELPESNECEEGEEAEPELYCFEDFISYDLQPQRPPLERTISVNPEIQRVSAKVAKLINSSSTTLTDSLKPIKSPDQIVAELLDIAA
uniref:Uncharacterized protein n=1 Tax=Magallana gigas TaxID=29159 RepID=K1QUS3_MAGGI